MLIVLGTFVASLALLLYEASVVAVAPWRWWTPSVITPRLVCRSQEIRRRLDRGGRCLPDRLGLYVLFNDENLPLPRWLEIRDLDDLKNNLVSVVIAVPRGAVFAPGNGVGRGL